MALARSPAPAARVPLRAEEGGCSAQYPGGHQRSDIPRNAGGRAEPTRPFWHVHKVSVATKMTAW